MTNCLIPQWRRREKNKMNRGAARRERGGEVRRAPVEFRRQGSTLTPCALSKNVKKRSESHVCVTRAHTCSVLRPHLYVSCPKLLHASLGKQIGRKLSSLRSDAASDRGLQFTIIIPKRREAHKQRS